MSMDSARMNRQARPIARSTRRRNHSAGPRATNVKANYGRAGDLWERRKLVHADFHKGRQSDPKGEPET